MLFKQFLLLIFLHTFLQPSVAIELPDIGASSGMVVSATAEKKIGEAVMRSLRRQLNVIDDLEINHYFESTGKKLVSYTDTPSHPFHFFVVDSAEVNAFAMPGGFIGIYSGLILSTQDESELASVLAHEIAHVTQHHLARTFEAVNNFSLPMAIATIAAVVASAALNNAEIGQAAIAALTAGGQQMQVNFTRTHEKEADRIGIQLLADAGFDPLSMPNFFETLQNSTRYYQQGIPEFLRTHPVTTNRIAEARERAKKYPKKPLVASPHYQLMRAKLLVLTEENKNELSKKLQEMLKEGRYRSELATRYALVLALLASEKTEGVQAQIDWLFKQDGDRVIYRLQQARLTLLQGQVTKALQLYEQALAVYPDDLLLSLDYAEKLLQNNNPEQAKGVLLALSSPPISRYYQLLAQIQRKLGNTAEAHLALAEDFYLQGRTALALNQLEHAREQETLDFYVAARIEARYQALKTLLQEEQESSAAGQP